MDGTGTLEYWEGILHLGIYICLVLLTKYAIRAAGISPDEEEKNRYKR